MQKRKDVIQIPLALVLICLILCSCSGNHTRVRLEKEDVLMKVRALQPVEDPSFFLAQFENEITLPLYSTLTEEDVRYICQTLKVCLQDG